MGLKVLQTKKFLSILITFSILIILISLLSLSFDLSLISLLDKNSVTYDIFYNLRLPTLILAFLIGAGLSLSGATFQSLLQNPLADPYILGVSGGAALGSVIALVLGASVLIIPLAAFFSALLSLFFIFLISQVRGRLPRHTLLLSGVIFNSFSFALILLINSFASFEQNNQILYILMGSLESQSYVSLLFVALIILISSFAIFFQSPKLNLISMGDETASQLGISLKSSRLSFFIFSSLIVGVCVAFSGLIGFIGLFVPHILRLILGSDHRLLLPASFLGGGFFLILANFISDHAFSYESLQTELPVGIVTAILGAPYFLYLIRREKKNLC